MPRSRPLPEACPETGPPEPATLDTAAELRLFLRCSPTTFKRFLKAGLPWVADLSLAKPGRKHHRALRFDRQAVLQWLHTRGSR